MIRARRLLYASSIIENLFNLSTRLSPSSMKYRCKSTLTGGFLPESVYALIFEYLYVKGLSVDLLLIGLKARYHRSQRR